MPIDSYLLAVVTPLLSKPGSVTISQTQDDMGILLALTVAPEDMGPIIGKMGETAKAIRHLVRVAGVKQNMRVSVKINEPDGTPYRPRLKETAGTLAGNTK